MATILDKQYTEADSDEEILRAIHILAADKNSRLLLTDCVAWLETKATEIDRLVLILLDRLP